MKIGARVGSPTGGLLPVSLRAGLPPTPVTVLGLNFRAQQIAARNMTVRGEFSCNKSLHRAMLLSAAPFWAGRYAEECR